MISRFNGFAAALLLAPLLSIGSSGSAQARPPTPLAAPSTPQSVAPTTHHLTLITGDRVELIERSGQMSFTAQAAQRPGRAPVTFVGVSGPGGAYYVFPSDARQVVASGIVDRDLFNLPLLVAQGLDDASSALIPLLTQVAPAASLDTTVDPLPGYKIKLPHFRGAGLRVERARIAQVWDRLVRGRQVSRVWLDRKVAPADDLTSVHSGRSGQASPAPLDGTGVTVAVLDTGIDATHPDLTGAVAEAVDFTDEGNPTDTNGHGTHVASIIAGTGAASGGRYRGVAPGVRLLNGKVLGRNGGLDSWVIAGMEWAVQRGARIVNMSLGSGATDGTDPLSEEVDRLTAETGTLFVVAAGNSGHDAPTISAPGAAEAALTVGAVDSADHPAAFSSGGPRLGDAAAKPNIVAAGVDIVAARAAGTSLGSPVDEHYTRLSGTSMATPQVAGAAAVLAAARPRWRAEQLRSALTSTATDIGVPTFVQGSGRLDLTEALSQAVVANSTVDFGQTRGGTLTYVNQSDVDMSLRLAVSAVGWNGGATDAFGLSTSTVTVPANGSASVQLTMRLDGLGGVYGGVVTGRTADGSMEVRTPLGAYVPPRTAQLSLRVLDSTGSPAPFSAIPVSRDDLTSDSNDPFLPGQYLGFTDQSGESTLAVPVGVYTPMTFTQRLDLAQRRYDLLTRVEVPVDGPTEVVLDARDARPLRLDTPEPTVQREHTATLVRNPPQAAARGTGTSLTVPLGATQMEINVTPAPAAVRGTISLIDYWRTSESQVTVAAQGTILHPEYDPFAVSSVLRGFRSIPIVFASTPAEVTGLNVQGKVALVRLDAPPDGSIPWDAAGEAVGNAEAGGALAVMYYVDLPGVKPLPPLGADIGELSLSADEGAALASTLARQQMRLDIAVKENPSFIYTISQLYQSHGIPSTLETRVERDRLTAIPLRIHVDKPPSDGKREVTIRSNDAALYDLVYGFGWSGVWLQGPAALTEYVGPVDSERGWTHYVTEYGADRNGSTAFRGGLADRVIPAGTATLPTQDWFEGPGRIGVSLNTPDDMSATGSDFWTLCGGCRGGQDGDIFVPPLHWMDNTPGHDTLWWPWPAAATTTVRLLRGTDEVAPVVLDAGWPSWQLDPQPALYRLEESDGPLVNTFNPQFRAADVFRLAPQTSSIWTFHSARPDTALPSGYLCSASPTLQANHCAFQPLLQLRYDLPLDLYNQVSGPHSFDLWAGSMEGPATGVTVGYSTNDGKKWQQAVVTPTGPGRFAVHIDAGGTGFVSLRTQAWDAEGNRIEQTIRRAYALASSGR